MMSEAIIGVSLLFARSDDEIIQKCTAQLCRRSQRRPIGPSGNFNEGRTNFLRLAGHPQRALQPCIAAIVSNARTLVTATHVGERPMLIELIIWLIVGAIAGWLAGLIVKGYSFGLLWNIVIGIVGGLIAGWLLPLIGIFNIGGIVGAIVYSLIGAVILLVIVGLFKR